MSNGFGRKDSIWGGETITCSEDNDVLGVKNGDRFRVEKGPLSKLTLIPDPDNQGTWKDSHDVENPVKINPKKHTPTSFERAYSMMVTIKKEDEDATELFLVEKEGGSIAISSVAVVPPEHDHDIASVER